MILAVSKGFVDGAMISAASHLRGMTLGLRELIDSADLGVPYLNSPLSTRRAFIKTNRDTVLKVLRAYYQAVQETHNDRDGAMKILAKYTRVTEPEILAESYRIYGQKHLQKTSPLIWQASDNVEKLRGSCRRANPTSLSTVTSEEWRRRFFSKDW